MSVQALYRHLPAIPPESSVLQQLLIISSSFFFVLVLPILLLWFVVFVSDLLRCSKLLESISDDTGFRVY